MSPKIIKPPSAFQIYTTSQTAWDAMYQAIQEAKRSIYWELYIFLDDQAGQPFFNLLEAKAQAGVEVKLIIDSLGSFWLPRKRIQSLKQAGVDLRFFHERKHRYQGWWWRFWSRSHRKILVLDKKVGFIGGINIQKQTRDWLDLQVKIEGPAVHSLLRSFAKSYIICGGEKKRVRHLLQYKFRVRSDAVDFIFDDATTRVSTTRKKYTEALLKAKEKIILFSPYYFPDKKFLYALWQARKKGVKVDLLIPFRSDIRLATYATYAWFAVMQKYGVRIHLSKKMMHGKGLIVDDDSAFIGSSNLDPTSFYQNYEANVQIKDKPTVRKIKRTINTWFKQSLTLKDINWHQRGRWQKLKERAAYWIYRLWYWQIK